MYDSLPFNASVPVQRLRARLAGVPSKSSIRGHNKKLSEAQELILCSYLSRLSTIGAHARRNMLLNAANTLLRLAHHHSKRKPPVIGLHWVTRFIQRHFKFTVIIQKPLAVERKVAEEIGVIEAYFERFRDIKAQHGVADEDCWNFDETGFQISVGRHQEVSIKANNKINPRLANPDNRESITSIKYINCAGALIPSIIILAGKQILESMINNDLDDDIGLAISDTGYINDVIIL